MNFTIPERLLQRTVRILLVGAGGTGSQMADQLASLEVTLRKLGHPGFDVVVVDPDVVSESNIGRQRFTPADVGAHKSVLLVHRINAFYCLSWRASVDYFSPYDYGEGRPFDILVTCVDKAQLRAEIGRAFTGTHSETLWLDTGNHASTGNVFLGHLGIPSAKDGIRLPNVFDLYPELESLSERDEEEPSCSTEEAITRQEWPVNRWAALIATELLWTLFRHGEISTHGAFFKLGRLQVTPLPIDPETWRFMGYDCDNPNVMFDEEEDDDLMYL